MVFGEPHPVRVTKENIFLRETFDARRVSHPDAFRAAFGTFHEWRSRGDIFLFVHPAHEDRTINHERYEKRGKKANDAHGGEAINIMSVHRHVVSNVESLAKRDGS